MAPGGYSQSMTTWWGSRTRGPIGRGRALRLVAVLLVVWLIIGAIAAGQRHYFRSAPENCAKAGTIVVTMLAGPLNYAGANPKISCHVPQPSK
jgi:hypothetical protein